VLPKDTMDVKEASRYLAMDEKVVTKKSIDKWRGRTVTR
jgi:hypothetical protein